MAVKPTELRAGSVVIIRAFDDVPEHRFRIETVEVDCVTGVALTGPLAGAYGEPPIEMIRAIHKDQCREDKHPCRPIN